MIVALKSIVSPIVASLVFPYAAVESSLTFLSTFGVTVFFSLITASGLVVVKFNNEPVVVSTKYYPKVKPSNLTVVLVAFIGATVVVTLFALAQASAALENSTTSAPVFHT